jgi:aminoglycoside phosphotransferase family enzyme
MIQPRLVEAMFRPEFYPHRPEHGDFIQTRIPYIFIAGDYVYNVKKAVDFDASQKFLFSLLVGFL